MVLERGVRRGDYFSNIEEQLTLESSRIFRFQYIAKERLFIVR